MEISINIIYCWMLQLQDVIQTLMTLTCNKRIIQKICAFLCDEVIKLVRKIYSNLVIVHAKENSDNVKQMTWNV